ncbi:hypothetical protein KL929_000397 [Ogataea haglerorum]|nr:hypothetical protein KL951_002120 [Ogataea haglerorum]KAG7750325.1 hypothetical protein KL912_000885 [Ogataea haglerorum]KAG7787068.1 hypothetical protein KL910_003730 [Ogataea haglerorum]KAG7788773.1 hypothetical protein KL945_002212 [Ogataea haglerorum]KAG7800858.1 hypothetical protein KL929_000397 [Ogataea haglerorum]
MDSEEDSSSITSLSERVEDVKAPKKQPWKKLLWYKQDYEDNYTDASFLSQLKRNSTVINYSYWKLLSDFTLIVLHLSIIMLVVLVFYGIYRLNWNPLVPALLSSTLTALCFIVYVITLKIRRNRELINLQKLKIEQLTRPTRYSKFNSSKSLPPSRSPSPFPHNLELTSKEPTLDLERYLREPNSPDLFNTLKSAILILLTLLTFSPVLKSLTNSTASDSIWALSTWLCLLNVLFHDYSIDFSHTGRQSETLNFELQTSNSNLSKNISLSNAIVLASRLNSNLSAFCFIVFSIEVSGLFPVFNNFTRRCQFWAFHWFQVVAITVAVDFAVYKIFGVGWFLLWVGLQFSIMVIGPWHFIMLQKYKDELQGPWDPAKPIFKTI